ncbi:MAG: endonuclease/exonuclease/phosphatase family protein [Bacteroidales bacterium]|nr:endonuclease/exonuclease/phosphatase family protein [Bacteroidales bacterium]
MNIKMKKTILLILAALFLMPYAADAAGEGASEGLKVMSYNIRLGSANDGTNQWALRASATQDMLEDQAPDVFGVQEALDYQVHFIEEMCGYEYVGVGRENGKKEGEHMAIFWNKKKVSMLKWGTFWLSETPEEPSMGWDAACKRTATWALMKDKKTGRKFYFINTHLDHEGKEAQKNGLKLIVDRLAEINPDGLPMVLTGDFNITPDNKALTDLDAKMQSARKIAEKTDSHDTYNGWGRGSGVIDYIYVSGFSSCPEFQTVVKRYKDRKFISDHYPVFARIIF